MKDIVEWSYNEAPQEWTPQSYWIHYKQQAKGVFIVIIGALLITLSITSITFDVVNTTWRNKVIVESEVIMKQALLHRTEINRIYNETR